MKLLLCIILIFLSVTARAADTLLAGFDSALVTDDCWSLNAQTIEDYHWKLFRSRAHASGTISYFKWGNSYSPTGCTNDSGCWAIYEAGTSSSVGALKAYNCFSGYDWTEIGIGNHTMPVATTVTDLNIVEGNYYWLVLWTNAIDTTYYMNAGCTSHPYTHRLRNVAGCNTANMDAMRAAVHPPDGFPPDPSQYNAPVMTTIAWGVWASESPPVPPSPLPPSPPTNLRVLE